MTGQSVRHPADAGTSMVEVLVALGILGLLGTLILSFGIATAHVTDQTTGAVDLNEEARIAVDRLARDLRDADRVTAVMPAGTASGCPTDAFTGISFTEGSTSTAAVPHAVAYRWDQGNQQLILSEAVPDPQSQPILAAKVSSYCIELWSSRWSPVPDDPDKGTSWAELDPPSTPATPATWWCPGQLGQVDRVSVTMTASLNGHQRTYSTDVFLRNAQIDEEWTGAC